VTQNSLERNPVTTVFFATCAAASRRAGNPTPRSANTSTLRSFTTVAIVINLWCLAYGSVGTNPGSPAVIKPTTVHQPRMAITKIVPPYPNGIRSCGQMKFRRKEPGN
jgi:hypothetical protein